MPKLPIYLASVIAVSSLVIILSLLDLQLWSSAIELFIVPTVSVYYFFKNNIKAKTLSLFFIFYSLGDIANLIDFKYVYNSSYYVCNLLYISGYSCLFLYITKNLSIEKLLNFYKLDFLVLLFLDVYMIYVLLKIVKPIGFETKYIPAIQLVELLFSLVLILVMSVSFLNYIQNTQKKYFILFLGCLSLAFSELILIGYYYITDDILLSYTSTVLYVLGFFTILYQSFILVNNEKAVVA